MKIIIAAIVLSLMVFVSGCSEDAIDTREYIFAQCLADSGAVMYGTEWCPHCKDQKEMFGKDFVYVNYVDCDKQRDSCIAAGVKGYPTWTLNGTLYPGTKELEFLSKISGCPLSGN